MLQKIQRKKHHRTAVIVGVLMGITAPILAMIPSSHSTEAAIAVVDSQNIEQAIRTAVQTAQILTEEQKKLALMVMNAKKVTPQMIFNYVEEARRARLEQLEADADDDATSPDWDEESEANYQLEKAKREKQAERQERHLKEIENILLGNTSVWDVAKSETERSKAEQVWSEKNALRAANSIDRERRSMSVLSQAMDASNNADGTDQILQAGNLVNAIQVQNQITADSEAARFYQAQYQHWQNEAMERDKALARQKAERNAIQRRLNRQVANGDIPSIFARPLED